MPTDFSRQFKREVFFKKAADGCSWSKHVALGSALREVVRALEFLAKKYPDRYVFASPKALLIIINRKQGKFRKGRGHGQPLSLVALKKCLSLLQREGIVSPTLKHSPSGHQPTPGRVFAPHDDCCDTYPKRCEFIGPGKKGKWLETWPNAVWVLDHADDIEFVDSDPEAFIASGEGEKQ